MKKLLLVLILTAVIVGCQKQQEPPIDLSEHVTVTMIDDALLINTERAEKKLGRSFGFTTHRRMSSDVVAVYFYDKNANLIGYANARVDRNE